ncbi:MAG: hypothetical protein A3H27_00125 [Acidobacteria bacterium RIFCSPLOWO2_02_FULL_59_13]|nr:MAG: hypothetical protein A3H27_00125 [Acidobacteria bacterium RIFCSPLOWO2_02_FULL_59_13]
MLRLAGTLIAVASAFAVIPTGFRIPSLRISLGGTGIPFFFILLLFNYSPRFQRRKRAVALTRVYCQSMPLELDKFDDKISISDIVLSRIGRARQVRYFRRRLSSLRVRAGVGLSAECEFLVADRQKQIPISHRQYRLDEMRLIQRRDLFINRLLSSDGQAAFARVLGQPTRRPDVDGS